MKKYLLETVFLSTLCISMSVLPLNPVLAGSDNVTVSYVETEVGFDGRAKRRSVYSDGKVTVEYPDGSKTTALPGNKEIIYEYSPESNQYKKFGQTERHEYADGTKVTKYGDEKTVTETKDGYLDTTYKDGTYTRQYGDGSIMTQDPKTGEKVWVYSEKSALYKEGQKEYHAYEDGSTKTVYNDGKEVTEKDGITVTETKDGKKVTEYPDGTTQTEKDGITVTEYTDGEKVTEYPDGTTLTETKEADGKTVAVKTDSEGNVVETTTTTTENGVATEVKRDSSGNVTMRVYNAEPDTDSAEGHAATKDGAGTSLFGYVMTNLRSNDQAVLLGATQSMNDGGKVTFREGSKTVTDSKYTLSGNKNDVKKKYGYVEQKDKTVDVAKQSSTTFNANACHLVGDGYICLGEKGWEKVTDEKYILSENKENVKKKYGYKDQTGDKLVDTGFHGGELVDTGFQSDGFYLATPDGTPFGEGNSYIFTGWHGIYLTGRPFEFGHLSYHSMLNDTLGEFSDAEEVYNAIFNGVSFGMDMLGAVPSVINGISDIYDAYDQYEKNKVSDILKSAAEDQMEALQDSEYYDDLTISEAEASQNKIGQAEQAENQAELHEARAKEIDEKASQYADMERQAREDGDEIMAEEYRKSKEGAIAEAAEQRVLAAEKQEEAAQARQEAQEHYDNAVAYQQEKEAADKRYEDLLKQEEEAEAVLRDRTGMTAAQEDRKQAESDIAEAQRAQEAASRRASDMAAEKENAKEAAEVSMVQASSLDSEAKRLEAEAQSAKNIGDNKTAEERSKAAAMFRQQAAEARDNAVSAENEAKAYEREEAKQRGIANEYEKTVQSASQALAEAKRNEEVANAEYAVRTGTATDEQEAIYQKAQEEAAQQRAVDRVAASTNRMPSLTRTVHDATTSTLGSFGLGLLGL